MIRRINHGGVYGTALLLSLLLGPVQAQETGATDLGALDFITRSADDLADMHAKALSYYREGTMAQVYSQSAVWFGEYLVENCDSFVLIESAPPNMALLWELWTQGTTSLSSVVPLSAEDLAGIFIGMAADPDKPVTADTVTALAAAVGVDPSTLDVATISRNAAAVQSSLAEAKLTHG